MIFSGIQSERLLSPGASVGLSRVLLTRRDVSFVEVKRISAPIPHYLKRKQGTFTTL